MAQDVQLETLTPAVTPPTFPGLPPTSQLHEASHYPCLTRSSPRCWREARRGPDRRGHGHNKVPFPCESEERPQAAKGMAAASDRHSQFSAASLFSTWELAVYVPTSPSRLEMCCRRDRILVTSLSSSCCPSYTAQNWHIWNVYHVCWMIKGGWIFSLFLRYR